MLLPFISAIPLAIWIYLLTGRGKFWRVAKSFTAQKPGPLRKRVVAVIPARNEALVIGRALRSLSWQNIDIVVVDDGSTDGTAEIARAAIDNVTILQGRPLPPGWTGKLWALSQGVVYAEQLAPDYLLFTDADIRHGPNSIGELVAIAEARGCDLASYMVRLTCNTPAEKMLIPAFVYFFLMLYPPRWIASARSQIAGAAGGCILIRPEALRKIGGLAAIKCEVIDDCALARAVKRGGGRIWLGLSASTESVRSYGTLAEIGSMISRTAFNQLHHSAALLVVTVAGLFFTYLLPPLLLLTGKPLPAALGAAAWMLMAISYLPTVRFYHRSAAWSLALPAIALFYASATIHSAFQFWRGKGGKWKGRLQDVPRVAKVPRR